MGWRKTCYKDDFGAFLALKRVSVQFCRVRGTFGTAPKPNLLPLGEAESRRRLFRYQHSWGPGRFPDVELRSMAEFLLCRLAAFRHLSPSAFLVLPLPRRSMWVPALRECSSNAAPVHPPPRNPSRLALSGPRRRSPARRSPRRIAPRVVGAAGPVGHGRRGWPRTPAPGHRPCTRPTVVGYDR